MTLESFCAGSVIVGGAVAVTTITWTFLAEFRRRKRGNSLWSAFCKESGWGFAPYTVSWRGPVFPLAKGTWRGREFTMSVERSLPMVQLLGVKTGACNFGFMSRATLKELKKLSQKIKEPYAFPCVDSRGTDERYGVTASSQALAESILGHEELHGRMRQLVDQGCSVLGFNEDGACSAEIDWHGAPPAGMQSVLDLLCDLADAAERAAAASNHHVEEAKR